MKFVRAATIEEVLGAAPEDEPSRDIVRSCPAFGVWLLDREDIGNIGAQLPTGKTGTVSALLAEWKDWHANEGCVEVFWDRTVSTSSRKSGAPGPVAPCA